ncbi:ubiquitin 3 binding protein But2 C-terminal domain-containing protein [Xylariomycetidae sp. FL0641]|nr:ubiquitin 3 binding protein But2 C-terminal domain-containing protein [Xylariomycetidae sp. FL0641]
MIFPILSISWLVSANAGCAFHLSTAGQVSGSVGQLGSGQARAGSSVSPSLFTWFGDAFCDYNQSPDHGFQIGCDGRVSYNGQNTFYECATGDGDQVNLYLRPSGSNCSEATITADNCRPPACPGTGAGPGAGPSGQSPSSPATTPLSQGSAPTPTPFITGPPPSPTSPTSATATSTSPGPSSSTSCVEVGPDQIILTDKGNPDTAYGPNSPMNIQVTPNATSLFNFKFSDSDLGKTCELFFAIAPGKSYTLTGTGMVSFSALDGWANPNTTYNNSPRVMMPLREGFIQSGMRQGFGKFECPGSTSQNSISMGEAPYADTCFQGQQGNVNDKLGLYMSKC